MGVPNTLPCILDFRKIGVINTRKTLIPELQLIFISSDTHTIQFASVNEEGKLLSHKTGSEKGFLTCSFCPATAHHAE